MFYVIRSISAFFILVLQCAIVQFGLVTVLGPTLPAAPSRSLVLSTHGSFIPPDLDYLNNTAQMDIDVNKPNDTHTAMAKPIFHPSSITSLASPLHYHPITSSHSQCHPSASIDKFFDILSAYLAQRDKAEEARRCEELRLQSEQRLQEREELRVERQRRRLHDRKNLLILRILTSINSTAVIAMIIYFYRDKKRNASRFTHASMVDQIIPPVDSPRPLPCSSSPSTSSPDDNHRWAQRTDHLAFTIPSTVEQPLSLVPEAVSLLRATAAVFRPNVNFIDRSREAWAADLLSRRGHVVPIPPTSGPITQFISELRNLD